MIQGVSRKFPGSKGPTFLSAMYNASASFANLSFICGSCKPRPSEANLLSSGMV